MFLWAVLEVAQITSDHILLLDHISWSYPTAREAGKCSPAMCPGRRGNNFGNQLGQTSRERGHSSRGQLNMDRDPFSLPYFGISDA